MKVYFCITPRTICSVKLVHSNLCGPLNVRAWHIVHTCYEFFDLNYKSKAIKFF